MSFRQLGNVLTVAALTLLLTGAGVMAPDTPVADAAQGRDIDVVRELLRQGADVNAAQGDGMTALHWAARHGNVELGEVLLYAGANVHAGTRIGRYTALHMAARSAHARFVTLLLEAKAEPNAPTTNSGATPLHLAATSGNPGIVANLVEWGALVDTRESAWGQTPLTFAAANNRAEAIRALLGAGADPSLTAHVVDVVEQTEADRAADKRLTQFLADFKEKEGGGTNWRPTPSQVQTVIEVYREVQRKWPDVPSPDDDDEKDDKKEEPEEGEESGEGNDAEADSAGTAEEPEDVGGEGEEEEEKEEEPKPLSYSQLVGTWGGLTPLLHAARQGHMEAVLALLEGGADINQPSAGDGTQPLLMATINGQFDLAMFLIERGADPNAAGIAGTTPLFAVLERQWAPRASYAHPVEHEQQETTHLEVMEALLSAGADPNVRLETHLWFMEYTFSVLGRSGINLRGATPFWRATHALDLDAMRLLTSYGADPNIPTMKPPKRRRQTPTEEEEDKKEEGEEDAEKETEGESVENPKQGNAEGESADQEVGVEDSSEEEEDHSGVPPVPVNGPAIYPIHAASGVGYGQSFAGNAHRHVPGNWLAVVKFLVEEVGAEVDVRDANAYTALHHAASRGDNELILYLVAHGADATVLSRKGQTTADMANGPVQRVPPYPETVALLEKLGSANNHKCLSC
ncbi:MAG: ankyrin repeat domain-containing protein [Gemmatimonadetes bacterium]|nr:ankyrin repeat domain-containing protein [Gemmatimonadota bacterium]